ncbi:unnamed protein product [Pipistrellus nathusii]|uniref:Chemokine interleukin-8-like domain-containing protein n=1 Tax=Pipistrellus nathusii TaxID=59473 RepID=A0ABN9ZI89_PIPNA
MKVSATALSFIILATTLGSPAHGSLAHESWDTEGRMVMEQMNQITESLGFHRPSDCCPGYTSRKIRCNNMKSYYLTTSGCAQPGVIFTTKAGKSVCANPNNPEVQECIMNWKLDSVENLSRSHSIS